MRYPKTTATLLLCFAIGSGACQQTKVLPQIQSAPDPALQMLGTLVLPVSKPTNPGINATQKSAALVGRAFEHALDRCNEDKLAIANILGLKNE
jgi:hypothetical protein